MANSPLEAIEVSVAAELLTVTGLESVTVAPFADAFSFREDGTVDLNRSTLPAEYPGAILSLNDDDITVTTEDRTLGPVTIFVKYRVPVFVVVYATSDGSAGHTARWKAWEVAHAVIAKLVDFKPSGAPTPWIIEVDERMEPGALTPIVIDPSTFAILNRFYASYYMVAS